MALRMLKMQTLVIGSVCAYLMSCKAHYQYHELPEPKMTKVTFPVGVALHFSGSPYRNSMGFPAISRADSTGKSHRMSYGAARPKRVNAHPPWAQLHAIITYHEVYLDIAHMGNCVQIVCESNMSLLLYTCSRLMFALLLVLFFWIVPLVRPVAL